MPSTGTVGAARILLAAVVLATIATTSTVALTLPERAAADVEIPEFPTAPPTPAAAPAVAPVSGADIAAPVPEPERELGGGATSRSEPAPDPAEGVPLPRPDDEIWGALSERMRESVREACAEGRLDGPVCERV